MPKTFRKEFRADGCTARIRKKPSGKNGYLYEIRYRRNGYNISASNKNLEEAKQETSNPIENVIAQHPLFTDFLCKWHNPFTVTSLTAFLISLYTPI